MTTKELSLDQLVPVALAFGVVLLLARGFAQRATRSGRRRRHATGSAQDARRTRSSTPYPSVPARGRGAAAGALETSYRGYRMRSRLEARWGCFMDALHVAWDYEPQGFRLPDGTPYLPDFYLRAGWWLELKGQVPTAQEARRCAGLATLTGQPVVLAVGLPDNQYLSVYHPSGGVPLPAAIRVCLRCDRPYVVADDSGRLVLPLRNACSCDRRFGTSGALAMAFAAARGARFEHGESPAA